jgi:hypothetical protein
MHSEEGSEKLTTPSSIPMIYIVGNSYCGSTLLGFLLSSNPDIVFIGELKIRTWINERSCSCGLPIPSCPFYSDYFTTLNELKKSAFKLIRPKSVYSLLYRSHQVISKEAALRMEDLYHSVSGQISHLYPEAKYLVDSSKSIWFLNAWLHTSAREKMKLIWLRRQLKPNVASFIKRGNGFLYSLGTVLVNNFLTRSFLKRNKLNILELDYNQFYSNYEGVMQSVSSYLNLEIPSAYQNHHNHHVISGNSGTRKEFTGQFKGFHTDNEWEKILTKNQKRILSWLEK